jgi:hypothetical protein
MSYIDRWVFASGAEFAAHNSSVERDVQDYSWPNTFRISAMPAQRLKMRK